MLRASIPLAAVVVLDGALHPCVHDCVRDGPSRVFPLFDVFQRILDEEFDGGTLRVWPRWLLWHGPAAKTRPVSSQQILLDLLLQGLVGPLLFRPPGPALWIHAAILAHGAPVAENVTARSGAVRVGSLEPLATGI